MRINRGRVARFLLVAFVGLTLFASVGLARRPNTNPPPTPGPVPGIPEPGAFAVFAVGAGLVGIAIHRRQRKR